MWHHWCRAGGKDQHPRPAGSTPSSVVQDAICLRCGKGTPLAQVPLVVHQGFFLQSCFPTAFPQPSDCWCLDLFLPWCSTWHLPLLRDRNGKVRLSFLSRLIQVTCFPTVLFYTFSIPYFLPYFSIFYQIFLLFPATFQQLLRTIKSLPITFALWLLTLQDLVKPVLQGIHTFKLNEIYLNEFWNYCLINSTAHVPCLRCDSSLPGANIYACQDQTEQNKCHQD